MGNCVRKLVQCAHVFSNLCSDTTNPVTKGGQCLTSPSEEIHKERVKTNHDIKNGFASMRDSLHSFSFSDLKSATRNFRQETLLGEGGFGGVFKGWIDRTTFSPSRPGMGMAVAVKQLNTDGFQGHKEWLAEVSYLGQLRHENLVKLIGYCSESNHRLLVYEFMPKGSLENHLFSRVVEPIDWVTRMNIAVGVARGLSYLHNLDANVIYRDLKASNVLLDSDYNARLSDFGLARDGPTGDDTHVSTRVMGTQGYAAPEYIATGHLTTKSDVYSFGVVLLELLSGRRSLDNEKARGIEECLVDWAKPFLCDTRRVLRIMDTKLGGQYPKKGAQAAAALAMQCLRTNAKNRPHMKDVLATLESLHTLKDVPRNWEAKLENPEVKRSRQHLNHRHKPKIACTN